MWRAVRLLLFCAALGGLLGDVGRHCVSDEHRRRRLFRHAIKRRRDASIAKLKQRRHLGEFLVDLQLRRSACAGFAKRKR